MSCQLRANQTSTYTMSFCPSVTTCWRQRLQNADLWNLSFILSARDGKPWTSSGGGESIMKSMNLQNFSNCISYLYWMYKIIYTMFSLNSQYFSYLQLNLLDYLQITFNTTLNSENIRNVTFFAHKVKCWITLAKILYKKQVF